MWPDKIPVVDQFRSAVLPLPTTARWVAYTSNESGLSQVYVAPFPGPGDRSMISGTGGHMRRWSGDGKQIFFLAVDGTVMAVGVNGDGVAFEFRTPQRLFMSKPNWSPQYHYDVTTDGQRFLMATPPDDTGPARPITVVLNWQPTGGSDARTVLQRILRGRLTFTLRRNGDQR